jgi:starvation-inducible DNA-binding protein
VYKSPSRLPEKARKKIGEALRQPLLEGLDLHSQIKVAHWNIKGPHFASLHPLFETFAVALAGFTDEIAERAVTLGDVVPGTSRQVAATSKLDELPRDSFKDMDLVALLADRIEAFLDTVRAARDVADKADDQDTVDLLTGIVTEFEKHAWFLRASL